MKITIEFSTDNAAFEDNPGEIEHVLTQARRAITNYAPSYGADSINFLTAFEHSLHDSNGNTVGTVRGELDE